MNLIMNKKIVVSLSLFLFLILRASFTFAENISPISLEDAFQLAVSHPGIEGKRRELGAASEKLDASKWLRFPSVSVQSQAGQASLTNNSATVITTLRVEQPLWTGGRISGNIDASTANLLAAQCAVDELEIETIVKTVTAYSNYLKFQQKLEMSNDNVAEHQRLLELIERRSRNEVSPMSEIILAKSRLDQAKTENIQIQTQMGNAKADLENYTNRKIDKVLPVNSAMTLPENINALMNMVLDFSPTIKKLTAQAAAAEAQIEISKSPLWPQLSARSDQNFGGVVEGNTTYLALTYSPGNGLNALSSARESEARKEAAEIAIKTSRLDLTNKMNTDWNQYKSEGSQIETLSNLSQTTKGVYQSYLRQYAAGKKTWLEVLNARKEQTQANYSLAESEWNRLVIGIRLQAYSGILQQNQFKIK